MPMVDIDWLSEHVEVPVDLTYDQLAKDLVSVGLEEEAIHESPIVGPLVVGYVVDTTPEPQKNGKTINWCHVDVGSEYNATDEDGNLVPRGIICGAPNMAAGEKVVVALPGAVLPGDFRIASRKTYGHISDGMCASERELGLSDEHNGIILLRNIGLSDEEYERLTPGDDAMKLLHVDEPRLEINITPDRGYAFSYRGVAREYHHATGAKYVDPVSKYARLLSDVHTLDGHNDSPVQVSIEDAAPIHGVAGCDRFYMRVVEDIDAEASTPQWMRRRLQRAGMRSISPAVDVTNYVMLDLGQPLHVYDLDVVAPPIVVRRASVGEKLVTLDGKEHELDIEDLLITDSPGGKRGSRILGLAGVMGGQLGEVTAATKRVLLEAAHFDPISVARSSRRHKIPSESARRFERGVDPQIQAAAVAMAGSLLEDIAGGTLSESAVDVNHVARRSAIFFRASEVERVAGLNLDIIRISEILEDIGCLVAGGGNGVFSITPPSWRPDLTQPCDLVEEIARIVGYDEIPTRVPAAVLKDVGGLTAYQSHRRAVANALAHSGLVEVLSYPFVGVDDWRAMRLDEARTEQVSVRVANPLAGDKPFVRRSMLSTLARTVDLNRRRGHENVSLFELGHVYLFDPDAPSIPALPGGIKPTQEQLEALDAGLPDQPEFVAGIMTGKSSNTGWLGQDRDVDYTDVLEILGRLGERLGVSLQLKNALQDDASADGADDVWEYAPSFHPGRCATIWLGALKVGVAGELHPQVNEAYHFPDHSAAFELNLTDLLGALDDRPPVQAKPVSTYPLVRQDLAFSVDHEVSSGAVQSAIRQAAGDLLESIELFDVFSGGQLEDDQKSLGFAVTFRASDRTLESGDIEQIRASIVEAVGKLGGQLRA